MFWEMLFKPVLFFFFFFISLLFGFDIFFHSFYFAVIKIRARENYEQNSYDFGNMYKNLV